MADKKRPRLRPHQFILAILCGCVINGNAFSQGNGPSDDDVDRALRVCSLGTKYDAKVEGGLELLKRRLVSGNGSYSESEIPSVIGSGVESDKSKLDVFEKIQKCVVNIVYKNRVIPDLPPSINPVGQWNFAGKADQLFIAGKQNSPLDVRWDDGYGRVIAQGTGEVHGSSIYIDLQGPNGTAIRGELALSPNQNTLDGTFGPPVSAHIHLRKLGG